MKKYYYFAGIGVEIDIPDQWMYEDEGLLTPFRVPSVINPYAFRFEMVSQLPVPVSECIFTTDALRVYADGERYLGTGEQAYARVSGQGRYHQVQFKQSGFAGPLDIHPVLNILGAEHLIAQTGGFVFHCAYIEASGKAILFTAPPETGKTTQAELWQRLRGAAIHNGDRCAVCWREGQAYACGIPFAGSSPICENVTLPLGAIVYLRQATKTAICRLRGAEAFRCIWEGCSVNIWDRVDVDQVSRTVMQVLETVPVFELACTPDESAIIALEGELEE